jgi:hypothetical protein
VYHPSLGVWGSSPPALTPVAPNSPAPGVPKHRQRALAPWLSVEDHGLFFIVLVDTNASQTSRVNHGKSTSEIPFLFFGAKKRCFPAFSFPSIHWIRWQFMGRPSLRLSGSLSEFDQSTIVARRESLGQWIYPDFIRWKMPDMPDVSRFPCFFLRFLRRIYNDIDN